MRNIYSTDKTPVAEYFHNLMIQLLLNLANAMARQKDGVFIKMFGKMFGGIKWIDCILATVQKKEPYIDRTSVKYNSFPQVPWPVDVEQ